MGQILKIRSKWKEIAGDVLAQHTEPVLIKGRVLLVLCDSPAWAQQVGIMTKVIEKQIRDTTGIKVIRIEGQFGMVKRSPQKSKPQRAPVKLNIDPADVKNIKDPQLARAVSELVDLKTE